jgi:3-deoxy-D-manno-octulosonate 8-phosphate phosphatase (KDO 8-P phosphatase)
MPVPPAIAERASRIRLLTCDVDGVLTDGRLYYDEDGRQVKAFCVLDGHWLKLLMATGVEVAWITGSRAPCVARRAADLGVRRLVQGREDKVDAWLAIAAELGIGPERIAHVGDDLPDLPLLLRAGLAVTVPGAPAVIRPHVHLTTAAAGGEGAVREVCELLMRAQGTFDAVVAGFSRGVPTAAAAATPSIGAAPGVAPAPKRSDA